MKNDNTEVKISWSGILNITMRKYLRYGIELDKFLLPSSSYNRIIASLNQKYGTSSKFIYGLSKTDSYDFFVSYPSYVEELDCNGWDILPKFKSDMIKIFFHYYDDNYLAQLGKEHKIPLNIYGKEDESRKVWTKEDGEQRVILQNVAWLSAVNYMNELKQEKKQGKEIIPNLEEDEKIRQAMCDEVNDDEYTEADENEQNKNN